jgi:hypothetical protein
MIICPVSASVQRPGQLVHVGCRLRLDCDRDNRVGKVERLEENRRLRRTKRVTGHDFLEAHRGNNVSSIDFVEFLSFIRVHLQEATHALLLAG